MKKYEEDKEKIGRIIGVHFPLNSNTNAMDTVGIEIEIVKSSANNIAVVQSNSCRRFKVREYNELTNFCAAEEFEDAIPAPFANGAIGGTEMDPRYKDLLMSELYELKNMWFMYSKKINSLLVILPQEILNRYDMVAKTLQTPVFDISKYGGAGMGVGAGTQGGATSGAVTGDSPPFVDIFNEIVYKMA